MYVIIYFGLEVLVIMHKLLQDLKTVDVDVEHTLDRFMNNEEIYLKFLNRFPDEKQLSELKSLLAKKQYDDTTLGVAHSLKGLTANLGMNKIFKLSAKIMNDIRSHDFEEIDSAFSELEKNYNDICSLIYIHKLN
jgi:HPt (histidine-containing phosphotransfer) domain-containing protein